MIPFLIWPWFKILYLLLLTPVDMIFYQRYFLYTWGATVRKIAGKCSIFYQKLIELPSEFVEQFGFDIALVQSVALSRMTRKHK